MTMTKMTEGESEKWRVKERKTQAQPHLFITLSPISGKKMLLKHTMSWWARLAVYAIAARTARRTLGSWTRVRNVLILAALANAAYSRGTKKQLDVTRDGAKEFSEAGLSCSGAKFKSADGTVLQYYLIAKSEARTGKNKKKKKKR